MSESKQERGEPIIRLDDFLKRGGLVATGGEAKLRIQAGEVLVNSEVETRRRRQLRRGDVVQWMGEDFVVGDDGFGDDEFGG